MRRTLLAVSYRMQQHTPWHTGHRSAFAWQCSTWAKQNLLSAPRRALEPSPRYEPTRRQYRTSRSKRAWAESVPCIPLHRCYATPVYRKHRHTLRKYRGTRSTRVA
eukprot:2517638-Rhodomonas_salina.5